MTAEAIRCKKYVNKAFRQYQDAQRLVESFYHLEDAAVIQGAASGVIADAIARRNQLRDEYLSLEASYRYLIGESI